MNNKTINKIHQIVSNKMGNVDSHFLNMMILNKLSQIATHLQINIESWDGTIVPTNFYGIALAPSGYNKGRINNLLEDEVFNTFKYNYEHNLFPKIAEANINMLAERKASKDGIEYEEALDILVKRWDKLPQILYDFSDATEAGLKGAREKYTMANIGGTCMQIDEIAYNLAKFEEVLTVLLEAYDVGKSKDKLIKVDSNGSSGKIPSTLFMFGSPTSLLNGSKEEFDFINMLRQGYARRCMFCYIKDYSKKHIDSPRDILNRSRGQSVASNELLSYFGDMASPMWHNKTIIASDDVWEKVIQYKIDCELKADTLKDYEDIRKFELSHRYWKLLKIMGLLSLAEGRTESSIEDFEDALSMCEESGVHFEEIMDREPNYVRLFNFMVDMGRKLTEADLYEYLHFYSNSNQAQRKDMRNLAMAYAYGENGFIRETSKNGVVFYEAEKMKATSLDNIIISYSSDITNGYKNSNVKWEELKQFVLCDNLHYTVHHFKDGYRKADNAINGFNLLVLDIDDGLPIDIARSSLSDFEYIIYTTKRHTTEHNRYRVIIPLSNVVNLKENDYKKFMENVFEWLPFDVDNSTKDIARKWQTNKGELYSNNGKMLDPNDFIPDTVNEKEHKKKLDSLSNLDSLERFFMSQVNDDVGRNNVLHKYAMMITDGGYNYETVEDKVISLNDKLGSPLSVQEIMKTIMSTVRKKIGERND